MHKHGFEEYYSQNYNNPFDKTLCIHPTSQTEIESLLGENIPLEIKIQIHNIAKQLKAARDQQTMSVVYETQTKKSRTNGQLGRPSENIPVNVRNDKHSLHESRNYKKTDLRELTNNRQAFSSKSQKSDKLIELGIMKDCKDKRHCSYQGTRRNTDFDELEKKKKFHILSEKIKKLKESPEFISKKTKTSIDKQRPHSVGDAQMIRKKSEASLGLSSSKIERKSKPKNADLASNHTPKIIQRTNSSQNKEQSSIPRNHSLADSAKPYIVNTIPNLSISKSSKDTHRDSKPRVKSDEKKRERSRSKKSKANDKQIDQKIPTSKENKTPRSKVKKAKDLFNEPVYVEHKAKKLQFVNTYGTSILEENEKSDKEKDSKREESKKKIKSILNLNVLESNHLHLFDLSEEKVDKNHSEPSKSKKKSSGLPKKIKLIKSKKDVPLPKVKNTNNSKTPDPPIYTPHITIRKRYEKTVSTDTTIYNVPIDTIIPKKSPYNNKFKSSDKYFKLTNYIYQSNQARQPQYQYFSNYVYQI